jgi:chromosomal replication initiation ATPase DnaA
MNAFTPFEACEPVTVPEDGMLLSLWRGLILAPVRCRTMREIATAVAERHGLTRAELNIRTNRFAIAHPRQEAMWEMYQTGKWSNGQIGVYFGGYDHSTVIHARQAHQARLDALQAEEAA